MPNITLSRPVKVRRNCSRGGGRNLPFSYDER